MNELKEKDSVSATLSFLVHMLDSAVAWEDCRPWVMPHVVIYINHFDLCEDAILDIEDLVSGSVIGQVTVENWVAQEMREEWIKNNPDWMPDDYDPFPAPSDGAGDSGYRIVEGETVEQHRVRVANKMGCPRSVLNYEETTKGKMWVPSSEYRSSQTSYKTVPPYCIVGSDGDTIVVRGRKLWYWYISTIDEAVELAEMYATEKEYAHEDSDGESSGMFVENAYGNTVESIDAVDDDRGPFEVIGMKDRLVEATVESIADATFLSSRLDGKNDKAYAVVASDGKTVFRSKKARHDYY